MRHPLLTSAHRLAPWLALATLALCPGAVSAQDDEGTLAMACARDGSWLRIGTGEGPAPAQARTTKVDWGALLRYGPQKNAVGDLNRTGTRTRRLRCGALEVRIRAGFLNANVQGELGAIEFPVVEILRGGKPVLPPTAFAICESGITRYLHHGPCPDAWAATITATRDTLPGSFRLRVDRTYLDEDYSEKKRTDALDFPPL